MTLFVDVIIGAILLCPSDEQMSYWSDAAYWLGNHCWCIDVGSPFQGPRNRHYFYGWVKGIQLWISHVCHPTWYIDYNEVSFQICRWPTCKGGQATTWVQDPRPLGSCSIFGKCLGCNGEVICNIELLLISRLISHWVTLSFCAGLRPVSTWNARRRS